jgi:hypothetical protein
MRLSIVTRNNGRVGVVYYVAVGELLAKLDYADGGSLVW